MGKDDAAARVDTLADRLGADPAWQRAMHLAPRHLFVPDVVLAGPPGGPDRLVDRGRDPAGWWDVVYSDTAIVIQLDDGATEVGAGEGDYTSSCSAPSMVLAFLDLLYVHDHHALIHEVAQGRSGEEDADALATLVVDTLLRGVGTRPDRL
jgi:protein-L-isoaspartate(D-aspartate) O-methyltransferase